ncbi:MAG: hypothetical protein QNJ97_04030 [Myxococcota bacterium]|nr:hypothetical protein [Myxococcota bacterium]
MKTTAIMVEFLVCGLLMLLAILLLYFAAVCEANTSVIETAYSTFAKARQGSNASCSSWLSDTFILFIVVGTAYGLGLFVETLAMKIFERFWHRKNKCYRLENLIRYLVSKSSAFKRSPLDLERIQHKDGQYTGIMRYFVYSKSYQLGAQIEKQLARLRVMRVLAIFFLLMVGVGCILLLRQNDWMNNLFFTFISAALCGGTIRMVLYRLNKFDESIERAYRVLLQVY